MSCAFFASFLTWIILFSLTPTTNPTGEICCVILAAASMISAAISYK